MLIGPLPLQSSSAALPFTYPTPTGPARLPGDHEPLVPAPSCAGWWAARVLRHWAEQQKRSLTLLLPLLPPSPWTSYFSSCWRIPTEGQSCYIHCVVWARAMINLTSRTRKNKIILVISKEATAIFPLESCPFPARSPGSSLSATALQRANTLEHKAWLSLLANMATNEHDPAIFLCSGYSFWLTSWNSIFHRMTTH